MHEMKETSVAGFAAKRAESEASQAFHGGRAAVAFAEDFELTGAGLAKAFTRQAESFVLNFSFDDSAHHVAL